MLAHPENRRTQLRARVRLVALAASLLASGNAAAEWLIDANAGVARERNPAHAADAGVAGPDNSASLEATAGAVIIATGYDVLTVGATAGYRTWARYEGLDEGSLGATAMYRRKLGLGLDAPWIALEGTGAWHEYRSDLRTGPCVDVRAELGKRFTAAVDAQVGIAWDWRHAPHEGAAYEYSTYGKAATAMRPDDGYTHPSYPAYGPSLPGNVFDLHGASVYVRGAWAVTEEWRLAATLSVRRGDVVATAIEGAAGLEHATAIALDPTFGDERYAYRLPGTTQTGAIALSRALGASASLTLDYTAEHTRASGGLVYRNDIGTLTFLYSF
jgi:hypothetical protein